MEFYHFTHGALKFLPKLWWSKEITSTSQAGAPDDNIQIEVRTVEDPLQIQREERQHERKRRTKAVTERGGVGFGAGRRNDDVRIRGGFPNLYYQGEDSEEDEKEQWWSKYGIEVTLDRDFRRTGRQVRVRIQMEVNVDGFTSWSTSAHFLPSALPSPPSQTPPHNPSSPRSRSRSRSLLFSDSLNRQPAPPPGQRMRNKSLEITRPPPRNRLVNERRRSLHLQSQQQQWGQREREKGPRLERTQGDSDLDSGLDDDYPRPAKGLTRSNSKRTKRKFTDDDKHPHLDPLDITVNLSIGGPSLTTLISRIDYTPWVSKMAEPFSAPKTFYDRVSDADADADARRDENGDSDRREDGYEEEDGMFRPNPFHQSLQGSSSSSSSSLDRGRILGFGRGSRSDSPSRHQPRTDTSLSWKVPSPLDQTRTGLPRLKHKPNRNSRNDPNSATPNGGDEDEGGGRRRRSLGFPRTRVGDSAPAAGGFWVDKERGRKLEEREKREREGHSTPIESAPAPPSSGVARRLITDTIKLGTLFLTSNLGSIVNNNNSIGTNASKEEREEQQFRWSHYGTYKHLRWRSVDPELVVGEKKKQREQKRRQEEQQRVLEEKKKKKKEISRALSGGESSTKGQITYPGSPSSQVTELRFSSSPPDPPEALEVYYIPLLPPGSGKVARWAHERASIDARKKLGLSWNLTEEVEREVEDRRKRSSDRTRDRNLSWRNYERDGGIDGEGRIEVMVGYDTTRVRMAGMTRTTEPTEMRTPRVSETAATNINTTTMRPLSPVATGSGGGGGATENYHHHHQPRQQQPSDSFLEVDSSSEATTARAGSSAGGSHRKRFRRSIEAGSRFEELDLDPDWPGPDNGSGDFQDEQEQELRRRWEESERERVGWSRQSRFGVEGRGPGPLAPTRGWATGVTGANATGAGAGFGVMAGDTIPDF